SVLVTALLLFLVGNLTTLIASDFAVYLASRFVTGLGGGLYLPVAVAAGTQLVSSESRGRVLSLLWGANVAGAVAGVPLGLWLAERLSWRAAVVLILILVVSALIGVATNKETL